MPSALLIPSCSRRAAQRSGWFPGAGLVLAALSLLGAAACQTTPRCEDLSKCGGDFLAGAPDGKKEWVATADDSCMDQLQVPINPVSLSQQPARPAGRKGVGQATVDWCSNLVFQPDGSVRYQAFFPLIPLVNATLKFDGEHYDAHFKTRAPQQLAFSAACRAAQGVPESCALLGKRIDESIRAEANVHHMRCADDDEGGCLCDYTLELFTSLPGTWGADKGIITFYDGSSAPSAPAPTDYCVSGDTLELTGHHGQQLFNRPNLRTLKFHPVSCSDGVQDQGEQGVDCNAAGQGPCAVECPTCDDGAQNGDEEGMDCGGACRDVCSCFNGQQDPWEEGSDCGGPCSLDCICTNGTQDANEAGVDCGDACLTRFGSGAGVPALCP